MSNLFIRKEFELTEFNRRNICDYLDAGGGLASLGDFVHEEGDYSFVVKLIPVRGYINLKCFLYKDIGSKLLILYATTYKIYTDFCLSNVFMIDTKNNEFNEINKNEDEDIYKEDIEFHFTFNSNLKHESKLYIENHRLPMMRKSIYNLFALIKYNSVTDDYLFRLSFEILYNIKQLKGFIKKTKDLLYVANQLKFLKTKLSYAGYDEDYLTKNLIEFDDVKTNSEILRYFLVATLDYLYNNSTNLIVDRSDLINISKSYYDNLIKDMS